MASTTFTDNQTVIYAAWLNDVNNVVYNGIFQSPSITATSMICNGTASGAGFTSLINNTFTAPGPIGSVTPNTGKFTTLQATGAFTGTSISATSGAFSGALSGTTLSLSNSTGITFSNTSTQGYAAGLGTGGQTWQDVSGTRAFNTVYTNSLNYPIMVGIGVVAYPSGAGRLYVNGVIVGSVAWSGNAQGYVYGSISAIIPPGNTYELQASSAGAYGWAELR
jgi:hypothetical protein